MSKFRITIDAMGGDYAPEEIVKGAVQAVKDLDIEAIVVGLKEPVEKELAKLDTAGLPVSIVEATQSIVEGEAPAIAVMRKPNSSVALATRLVKDGKADATLSAGSTGACMVSAFQYLGTLPGIERPVAGGAFFRLAPNTVILDLGANVDCQPYQTVEFAAIGSVYAKTFHGVEKPTIGLDIAAGKANVIVTDGFVGNILTKFCEGVGQSMMQWFLKEMKGKLPPDDLKVTANKIYGILSPGMAMGGGPLLGVDGLFGIAHGRSKSQQIVGTVKQLKHAWESGFIDNLRAELEKIKANLNGKERNGQNNSL
jgi:glycerol-3-phosphate acyltransferase PlsX